MALFQQARRRDRRPRRPGLDPASRPARAGHGLPAACDPASRPAPNCSGRSKNPAATAGRACSARSISRFAPLEFGKAERGRLPRSSGRLDRLVQFLNCGGGVPGGKSFLGGREVGARHGMSGRGREPAGAATDDAKAIASRRAIRVLKPRLALSFMETDARNHKIEFGLYLDYLSGVM